MSEATAQPDYSNLSISIGDWILDTALNTLRREHETVHLEPKAVAVLQLLVNRQGEPITRAELLETAWQDVIVSDDALTQVIIKLRKAFNDNSRRPEYIQTIPKRGYRLIAPVEVINKEPPKPESSNIPSYKSIALAVSLILLVFLIGFDWWGSAEHEITQRPNSLNTTESMSIAVLPFNVVSAAANHEMEQAFALGMTYDLSTDLSKLSALRVIDINRSDPENPPARYLVTGSVQATEQRIKLNINLLDSQTRRQLWSERYDQKLEEIFTLQQSLSREIVEQLSIKVSELETKQLVKRYTHNLSAYEAFLQGQTQLLLRTEHSNQKARDAYRQAIEHDPAFARAYAGLALSYAADFRHQWSNNWQSSLDKAADMASTAEQIDPDISEVYWVLGYVHAQKKEHHRALEVLEEAIALDPSYADAYALMGGIHTYIGDSEKTLPLLREAMRLKPDAGYLYYLLLGRAYFYLGNNEQAVINLQETLQRNNDSLEARLYLAATAIAQKDEETAEWEKEEINSLAADFKLGKWIETYPLTDLEQQNYLLQKLGQIGLQ